MTWPTAELLDGLRELAGREGTTLPVTLLAALQALLHRYTGQADIVVGTASASRGRAELAPLIGFLANTLPIRGDLSGDPPFTELLAGCKDATRRLRATRTCRSPSSWRRCALARDPSRSPVFQIALSYAEPASRAAGRRPDAWPRPGWSWPRPGQVRPRARGRGQGRRGLRLECHLHARAVRRGTVARLLGHLEVLLRGVVADPSARLSALPVLTEAELYAELVEWNDTAAAVPPGCVHEAIAAQAARSPAAVAAEFEGAAVDLRRAEPAGHPDRAAGCASSASAPRCWPASCMPTGLPRLAALLGIWKAGGGYVPLDPAAPADRLAFMISDTAMPVILTDDRQRDQTSRHGRGRALNLDAERDRISRPDDTSLAGTEVRAENVAYVIYTSGSTGQPKGVVIEHRQAMNFLHGLVSTWAVTPRDAVLAFSSLTFDASVIDLFTPLLAGARVVLAPPETRHSPPRLAALLRSPASRSCCCRRRCSACSTMSRSRPCGCC